MRVLVLGVYYANNLGDAVICDCVAARLQERFPAAEIAVKDIKARFVFPELQQLSMNQMERSRKRAKLRHFVTQYGGWDKERKHEEIRLDGSKDYIAELCRSEWDLVIFAGGQIFQDGFSLFVDDFVRQLDGRGIPVLFNACGTGPSWSAYVRSRLAAALQASCVHLISTRDNARLIKQCYLQGSDKQVIQVSDPALWCAQVYQAERNQTSDVIGLGVMYATSVNVRVETRFWTKLIQLLETHGLKWQFFVNGNDEDIVYAQYVLAQLSLQGELSHNLAPVPRTPRELVSTVAQYKSIISFRLHSHVIANSLGIPGIAILWDEKLQIFYQKLGYPERCKTIYDNPKQIWDALCVAEKQGTNLSLITRQRLASEQVLVDAIQREITQQK